MEFDGFDFDSSDDEFSNHQRRGYIQAGSREFENGSTSKSMQQWEKEQKRLIRTDIMEIFAKTKRKRQLSTDSIVQPDSFVKVAAPMVRYSKLPFRMLLQEYGNVDIVFTPMILAQPFGQSQIARDVEHSTFPGDSALVMQFASNNSIDLHRAAEHALPWVDGIDLNCGCPQGWAWKEGIGCRLLEDPEHVRDMMRQVSALPRSHPVTTSIKIRLQPGQDCVTKTVEYIKRAHFLGLDFITIHGRNRHQSSEKDRCDWQSLGQVIDTISHTLSIPIIINGDVFNLQDAQRAVTFTKADGVMAARGLLRNPTLFNPTYQTVLKEWDVNPAVSCLDFNGDVGPSTPMQVVEKFMQLSCKLGFSNHFITHHHLMYMLDGTLSKSDRRSFNILSSWAGIVDWMEETFGIHV